MTAAPQSRFADLDGLSIHYLEAGPAEAPPVLLLHGWPTSSFLWRGVIGSIAESNRVVAIDLPGFGRSDKPLGASYSFRYFTDVLDRFCASVGIEETGLCVHDLGGPVGLYWAAQQPARVTHIALLNTIVFAKPSWAVVAFITAAKTPGLRSWLASPGGLRFAMKIGTADSTELTDELLAGVLEPFADADARKALLRAGTNLHPAAIKEIEAWLPRIDVPVRLIYGTDDRILPDVAKTMRKVTELVPHAELTALEGCGHFLQEDRPTELGAMLAEFFAAG